MTDSSTQRTLPAAAMLDFVRRLRRPSKESPQNHDAPINLACPFFSATFRLVVCSTYGIMRDVKTGQGSPSASARGPRFTVTRRVLTVAQCQLRPRIRHPRPYTSAEETKRKFFSDSTTFREP